MAPKFLLPFLIAVVAGAAVLFVVGFPEAAQEDELTGTLSDRRATDPDQSLAARGYGLDAESLLRAATDGSREAVRTLVEGGIRVDTVDADGRTPLIAAAYEGHLPVVIELLSQGAEVNALDDFGASALMYAASEGHEGIVSTLLDAGADPDVTCNYDGWTALMYAAFEGEAEIAATLVKNGADLDQQSPIDGYTALMLAAFQGYDPIVRLLLDAGADASVTNMLGYSAVDQASVRGFERIAKRIARATR